MDELDLEVIDRTKIIELQDSIDRLVETSNVLRSELEDCKNELCLKCGNYKEAHRGACNDCRWRH